MANKQVKAATKDNRYRNWTFVVYAESAPADWQDQLKELGVPIFVSPYHDSDVNPDGKVKKPHWHVVVLFHGKQPEAAAQEISDMCSAVKVQRVRDSVGMVRYLTHADNPEKHQYDAQEVQAFGGADYFEYVAQAADTDGLLDEMMDWCIDQGNYSFFRLSNYARKNRRDWFRVITTRRTIVLKEWLKSFEWEIKHGFYEQSDEERVKKLWSEESESDQKSDE